MKAAGFTLVEVLVALSLFAVGMLGAGLVYAEHPLELEQKGLEQQHHSGACCRRTPPVERPGNTSVASSSSKAPSTSKPCVPAASPCW